MMPLEQTTINRTPSTSNNNHNTQDEPEIRPNYTWQQVKKRKRSNQSPETKIEGNPFSLIPKTDMKSSHGSQTRTCKQTRQMKQPQTLKIYHQENLNPHQYIHAG
jgi:hypothetical protein